MEEVITAYILRENHVAQCYTTEDAKSVEIISSMTVENIMDGFDKVVKHIDKEGN